MVAKDGDSRSARVRALMWNLRVDAAIGEVVEALRREHIDSLVLKGPTFADWYPPESDRIYVDGDIWVAPADVSAAEAALAELGFVATLDARLPGWWEEHASSWARARDGGKIDLHRKLQGAGAEPERVWAALWAAREPITIGASSALRLSESGRALYATLHATHHGALDVRGLMHLQAALDNVADAVWTEALTLAVEAGALEAFATGLRLLPAGAALASRISVPDARSVTTTLLASTPPPVALGFDQLAAAHWPRRFEILVRKAVPPPGFIRHWWHPAASSRRMLAVGYLYRPIWLLARAPTGYRAWRRARKRTESAQ
jgi:Uncharacterised nucleotidyltransferase